MSDGQIKVVMVSVNGDNETLRAAMNTFADTVRQFSTGEPAAIEITPAPPAVVAAASRAQKQSNGRVAAAVAKVRAATEQPAEPPAVKRVNKRIKQPGVGKGHGGTPYAGPALSCPECGIPCKTPPGLGRHRRSAHGVLGKSSSAIALETIRPARPRQDGMFDCTECDQSFVSAPLRDRHIKIYHPEAA